MYFLIHKKENFSFLWFRQDKSMEITTLFMSLIDANEDYIFTKDELDSVPDDHKFIVFIENPFEKVLYDAISEQSYNFEKYIESLGKKNEMQISNDFIELKTNPENLFFFNIHNLDISEIFNMIGKELKVQTNKNISHEKKFQNPNAKLYRQPFKDIDFFRYNFDLKQFYNQHLQSIVLKRYDKDFKTLKQYGLEYQNPFEKVVEKQVKTQSFEVEDNFPYFKAKTEMQRINNKVGCCHLYEDHFMFINEKGHANISKSNKVSQLYHESEFMDKNFNYMT